MKLPTLESYLIALRPQFTIIGIIICLQILSLFSFIPPPSELTGFFINLFKTYGLPLIVLASFIENFAGLGTYFPASIAILVAMALTAGNPAQAILTYIAIIIPAAIANILSYWVGYSARTEESHIISTRSSKTLLAWYGATYWHPQMAALTAMASGSEGIPFWRYVGHFLPVSFVWSVFWALLLYHTGQVINSPSIFTPLFYIYLFGWFLWGIRKHKIEYRA